VSWRTVWASGGSLEPHAGGLPEQLLSYPWSTWTCLWRWRSCGARTIPLLCSQISLARYSVCQEYERSIKVEAHRVLPKRDAIGRRASRREAAPQDQTYVTQIDLRGGASTSLAESRQRRG